MQSSPKNPAEVMGDDVDDDAVDAVDDQRCPMVVSVVMLVDNTNREEQVPEKVPL